MAGALVVLALALACTQRTAPASAGVSGTFDLALMGDLLFVTSSDRSELRAFDLTASPDRDWVRAPNPLEPLSIPVLERPVSLARDLRHEVDGRERTGPYLYAFGTGLAEVSVVAADRSILKEVLRLPAPAPVTAVAAIGPVTQGAISQLFFATFDGDGTSIWLIHITPPENLGTGQLTRVGNYPGFIATSMAPIPDRNEIAVALRSLTPGTPRTGRAFVLRGDGTERVTLQFPGPVRALQTHPGGTGALAGALMFGILDEEGCDPPGGCNGVVAVKVSDGTLDDVGQSGVPMKPLRFGAAVPINISVVAEGKLQVRDEPYPLMGMVTASDGNIYFFDAANGRHIDVIPARAQATAVEYYGPTGNVLPFEPGLGLVRTVTVNGVERLAPEAGEGVARTETIAVVYEGILPDLFDLPASDADGARFPAPAAARMQAQVGDVIQIKRADGSICPVDLAVSSIDDAGGLATADPIPPACAGRTAFRVRAIGSSPYVVTGTVSGYLGRTGHGRDFVATGFEYQHYREDMDPANPPPLIRFRMEGKPASTVRDARYLINISANFAPFFFRVDTESQYGLGPGWEMPHSVVHLAGPSTAFASYPSFQGGNGTTGALLEFVPLLVTPNVPNVQNLKPYR